ncbi:MAG: molybdopterin-dependent oxidoreductase, partial [Legionellaceae bacterium]
PIMPTSTLPYAELSQQEAILLLGCNALREVPLLGARLQKANKNGAHIYAINAVDYDLHVSLAGKKIVSPDELPMQLASILVALVSDIKQLPVEVYRLLLGVQPDETHKSMAAALRLPKAVLVTGALCANHPEAALLRTLATWISTISGAKLLQLTAGSNAAGAWLAGMIPHRTVAGREVASPGLTIQAAFEKRMKAYVLMDVNPTFDFSNPCQARQAMLAAEFVVALSGFEDESIQDVADVILPMALYAETSGTYINVDKTWQTVAGAIPPYQEARPSWKILRVLANFLHVDGFEYESSEDVLEEVKSFFSRADASSPGLFYPDALPAAQHTLVRVGEWPLYRGDALVRHAQALQKCASADSVCVRMNPKTALHLELGDTATVSQGDIEITLPLVRDERIALDVVWVANAYPETADLGPAFAAITVKR